MRTIRATILVDAEHRATIQLPSNVGPGEHRVTIEFNDISKPWKGFPVLDIPWTWPEDYTFRREDMYGDDGR